MAGIEAAADAATGALIAGVVEGGSTTHAPAPPGTRCLNCGTALLGEHCHACGQSAHVHRTAGAIGHEIAHGVFHFEGKFWRTLPMLLFHPGALTRRYVAGERARFVSPLAVFLFSVFLLFAIVANLPGWHLGGEEFLKPGLERNLVETRTKLQAQLTVADQTIAEATKEIAEERADPEPDTARIREYQQRIAETRKSREGLVVAIRVLPAGEPFKVEGKRTGLSWAEQKFQHARENPQLVLYKMKMSAYKYSWALIPLSVPFLWLLFPFSRRVGLYDHAVFATYSLSFMSLLAIALALLGTLGVAPGWTSTAAALIPPVHIYKQLRGAYTLGRISALIRTVLLIGFIFMGVVPAFSLLLVYFGVAD